VFRGDPDYFISPIFEVSVNANLLALMVYNPHYWTIGPNLLNKQHLFAALLCNKVQNKAKKEKNNNTDKEIFHYNFLLSYP
jgi:hypothetical protein